MQNKAKTSRHILLAISNKERAEAKVKANTMELYLLSISC